jgi:hypothetical protein
MFRRVDEDLQIKFFIYRRWTLVDVWKHGIYSFGPACTSKIDSSSSLLHCLITGLVVNMLKKVTKIEITGSNLPKCLNFIHHKSIGDLKQCEEIISCRGRGIIREIYDSNKVSGISVTLVKSYDDALSKFIIDIDSILNILSTNKLKKEYPFVLIEASPFDKYTEEITKYLSSKDFLRL